MPHRIHCLICAVLSLGLWSLSAFAQTSNPRPATGSVRPVAKKPVPTAEESPRGTSVPRTTREPIGQATLDDEPAASAGPAPRQPAQQGPAPQVVMQPVAAEMKAVLLDWEANTKNITSLVCPITRIEFDSVFMTETRSTGYVYFENPDKGRIDFKPADKTFLAKPGRVNAQGKPYKVYPGTETKWICTGKKIYILDTPNKQYDSVLIPPQNQGQNITRSPLPFLFGMKAQDAMQRFSLTFGYMNNPKGDRLDENGKPMRPAVHLVAIPRQLNEAKEYQRAEIIVDPSTYLPMNLRMKDPTGNKETVYSFAQAALKVNVKWGLTSPNPFKDPLLPGWTEMRHGNADPDQPPVRQSQNMEK